MLDTIRPYITRDEPFGPIDSIDIASTDIKALEQLFQQHNWIYKNLRNRPSIIIGGDQEKHIICEVCSSISNMIFMSRSELHMCWDT